MSRLLKAIGIALQQREWEGGREVLGAEEARRQEGRGRAGEGEARRGPFSEASVLLKVPVPSEMRLSRTIHRTLRGCGCKQDHGVL